MATEVSNWVCLWASSSPSWWMAHASLSSSWLRGNLYSNFKGLLIKELVEGLIWAEPLSLLNEVVEEASLTEFEEKGVLFGWLMKAQELFPIESVLEFYDLCLSRGLTYTLYNIPILDTDYSPSWVWGWTRRRHHVRRSSLCPWGSPSRRTHSRWRRRGRLSPPSPGRA